MAKKQYTSSVREVAPRSRSGRNVLAAATAALIGSAVTAGADPGMYADIDALMSFAAGLKNVLIPVDENYNDLDWSSDNIYAVKSIKGLYSEKWMSAKGPNPDMAGGTGGIDLDALAGYLDDNDYLTKGVADGRYMPLSNLDGYATKSWVQQQGYLTSVALSSYLSKSEAASLYQPKGDYATQSWVQQQGYLTTASLSGYLPLTGGTMANTNLVANLNADMLDGVHLDRIPHYGGWVDNPGYDANTRGNFIRFTYANNAPDQGTILSVSANNYGFQLFTHHFADRALYYRRYGAENDGGWGAWQRLARITDNVASASRLATTASFTAWGQTYFTNGVPQSISGNMTGVGSITAIGESHFTYTGGTYVDPAVGLGAAMKLTGTFAQSGGDVLLVTTTGNVAVGKTVANYKVDVAGTVRATALRVGDCEITWDAEHNGLKFSTGLYSVGYVSAKGPSNLSGGGNGGDYDRLDYWSDYTADKSTYALSAGLGWELHNDHLSLAARVASLEAGGGNYLGKTEQAVDSAKLGGISLDKFVYGNMPTATTNLGGTADAVRKSGFYRINDDPKCQLVIHSSHSSNNYAFQLGTGYNDHPLYLRHLVNNVWTDWRTILDSANYSSVLDSRYVTLDTTQSIGGVKTFTSELIVEASWIRSKIITGENKGATVQYKKSHGIELGYPNRDYMNFNEFGGVFNFYKTNTVYTVENGGDGALVAKITSNGITANSFIKSGGTSSQFLKADGSVDGTLYMGFKRETIDPNTLLSIGVREVNSATNAPTGSNWHQYMSWGTADNGYGFQFAHGYADNSSLYFRHRHHSYWEDWRMVLDSGNYSEILNNYYVKKSGDTMTGELKVIKNTASASLVPFSNGDRVFAEWRENDVVKGRVYWSPDWGTLIQGSQSNATPFACVGSDSLYWNGAYKFWHSGNDGAGSGLDADLLDGYHAGDLLHLDNSMWDANETVANYAKRVCAGYPGLHSASNWAWANSANLAIGSYLIDRQTYSAFDFRYGNLNGTWAQKAILFLPTYSKVSMIYIAQMTVSGVAGEVSTSVKRYADYDTVLASNVASATRLQGTYSLWGQNFYGNNVSGNMTGVGSIYMGNYLMLNAGAVGPYLTNTSDGGLAISKHNESNMYAATLVYVLGNGNVGIGAEIPAYKLDVNGTVRASGEIISTSPNAYRAAYGNYGFFIRNDGDNTYFMLTAPGDAYGTWSSLRPLFISNAGGRVYMNNGASVGTTSNSYALNAASFICDSWVRTKGSTGWYNETWGGGWYMEDGEWLKSCNSKGVYVTNTIQSNANFIRVGYNGTSWCNGRGALAVEIFNNNNQTPLLVAYRNGAAHDTSGANRLYSLELLNSGSELRHWMGSSRVMTMTSAMRVGIACEPAYTLDVSGDARITGMLRGGSISLNGGSNPITWDATNNAYRIEGNVYSTGGMSAKGPNFTSDIDVTARNMELKGVLNLGNSNAVKIRFGNSDDTYIKKSNYDLFIGDDNNNGFITFISDVALGNDQMYMLQNNGDVYLNNINANSLSINSAKFTRSGNEIYVQIGSTKYKLTKTVA